MAAMASRKRNARMSVSGSIDDNHIKFAFGLLNPIHQFAFEIGLAKINCPLSTVLRVRGHFSQYPQGSCSINIRLALPEQIQIRAVEKQNFHFDCKFSQRLIFCRIDFPLKQ